MTTNTERFKAPIASITDAHVDIIFKLKAKVGGKMIETAAPALESNPIDTSKIEEFTAELALLCDKYASEEIPF